MYGKGSILLLTQIRGNYNYYVQDKVEGGRLFPSEYVDPMKLSGLDKYCGWGGGGGGRGGGMNLLVIQFIATADRSL